MMPPVSLPLTGGTQSARAGPQTSAPAIVAASKAAPSHLIVISIVAESKFRTPRGP
jgi:hypothetical protein